MSIQNFRPSQPHSPDRHHDGGLTLLLEDSTTLKKATKYRQHTSIYSTLPYSTRFSSSCPSRMICIASYRNRASNLPNRTTYEAVSYHHPHASHLTSADRICNSGYKQFTHRNQRKLTTTTTNTNRYEQSCMPLRLTQTLLQGNVSPVQQLNNFKVLTYTRLKAPIFWSCVQFPLLSLGRTLSPFPSSLSHSLMIIKRDDETADF